jgi:hypothetical protein
VQKAVSEAKSRWHDEVVGRIKGIDGGTEGNMKDSWKGIRDLQKAFSRAAPNKELNLNKTTGEPCSSAKETADVVKDYFSKVFSEGGDFDPTVLESIPLREAIEKLGANPTYLEVRDYVMKMGNEKSPGGNTIPVEYYKAIMREEGGGSEKLLSIITAFWNDPSTINEDWLSSLLKLVPKKGNKRMLKNWRPVSLLDVCSKIVSGIIGQRLMRLLRDIGLEAQNGFMFGRGTPDGIASLLTAIRKRAEAGRHTYALFVDLVKAFDTVSRECMLKILAKYGVPEKMVKIIEALHTNTTVKFDYKGEERAFPSTVGVKQGDPLASILFLFVMQAAMETVTKVEGWPKKLEFLTRNDGFFHQRQVHADITTAGSLPTHHFEVMEFWASLYADDGAFMFDSRTDLEAATTILFQHFGKFGMKMHVGTNGVKSKTEAMYFPKSTNPDGRGGNTKDIEVKDEDGSTMGTVQFVKEFKYLGKTITTDLTDVVDITKKVNQAMGAFQALRECFFKPKGISLRLKGRVYSSLILSILLAGSEQWKLDAAKIKKLNRFHNYCANQMTGVFWKQQSRQHIKMAELHSRLDLLSIESYVTAKTLSWLGHVARMPWNRDPRRLLTSIAFLPIETKKMKLTPVNITLTFGHTIYNRHFKRVLNHSKIDDYPDIKEALSYKIDPPIHGEFKTLIQETGDDFIDSWFHIALSRERWLIVTTLAEHERTGEVFEKRLKKRKDAMKAKDNIMRHKELIGQHFYPNSWEDPQVGVIRKALEAPKPWRFQSGGGGGSRGWR